MEVFLTTAYDTPYSELPRLLALSSSDRFGVHRITDSPSKAQIILFADARADLDDWRFSRLRMSPLLRQYREKSFIYCQADQPWCAQSGLYTSMPRGSFNLARQRACAYISTPNQYILPPMSGNPRPLLFSFVGRGGGAVRERISSLRHTRGHIERTDEWDFFASDSAKHGEMKRRFAEVLATTKFAICPRGAGTSSFRLFEAMAAGCVPVILSDDWVPPEGPRWEDFSLTLPESKAALIPEVVEHYESRFNLMAHASRRAWQEWFAPDVLFHRMIESCTEILRSRRIPERIAGWMPDRRYFRLKARAVKARLITCR